MDRVIGTRGGAHPGHPSAMSAEEAHAAHVEVSEHSIWPLVVAVGLLFIGLGFLVALPVTALGVVIELVALIGWMWEPWSS